MSFDNGRFCENPECKRPIEDEANARKKYCDNVCNQRAYDIRSGRRVAGAGIMSPTPETDTQPAVDNVKRLKDEVRALKSRLDEIEREELRAEDIREKIHGIAGMSMDPPIWVAHTEALGTPGIPSTLWSDWHWGEVVNEDEVGGVNKFDSHIARRRVEKTVEIVTDLAINHMVNPNYPGIVVCLGGDMISGDIHQELAESNDAYTFQTILDVQDHIAAGLRALADRFGRVFVPCVVGNHGRNTIKPRMKGTVYTSFEWNVYCQLERYFKAIGDDRVQFYIPNESDAHFMVNGHRYNLTHGDRLGVKGGDGIIGSIGPIMRGTIKVGRSEAQIGRDFDTIVMGHWHQYLTLPGIIVNGALKGYDEFARLALRAPYQRPIQSLWFTHPKHGITAQWPLYLEPLRSARDTSTWVSWPGN